jgi:hypothetical protein
LLLQVLGRLLAGRFLLPHVLLQMGDLGLVLGHALVHTGNCFLRRLRAGCRWRRVSEHNCRNQQNTCENQHAISHYK